MSYLKKLLIAIDQLLNALLLGWPDESLSSRAYRWEQNNITKYPRIIIDHIFFLEDKHCYNSYISEREGRQLPPELR